MNAAPVQGPIQTGGSDRATRQAPLSIRSRVPLVLGVLGLCTRAIGADGEEYAVQEGVHVLGHLGQVGPARHAQHDQTSVTILPGAGAAGAVGTVW